MKNSHCVMNFRFLLHSLLKDIFYFKWHLQFPTRISAKGVVRFEDHLRVRTRQTMARGVVRFEDHLRVRTGQTMARGVVRFEDHLRVICIN